MAKWAFICKTSIAMLGRPTTTLRGTIIEGEGKRRVFTFFFRWITLFGFHYLIMWINVNHLSPLKSPIIQLKTTHPESSSTKMPRSAWVNTARHLVFVFHQFPVQLTLGQHGFELHRFAYMRIFFNKYIEKNVGYLKQFENSFSFL